MMLFTFLGLCVTAAPSSAQGWSLTTAQRKAYLSYYAPVIMKRANESSTKAGLDWMTNFDFDGDGNFSNNRVNWLNINQYVTASASGSTAYSQWRIRPTLYSALIEYMEGSSKSLVMIYHVYNAQDKDGQEIHDWERVEVDVRGVTTGTPGASGEIVNHVTVTHHHDHIMRRSYDSSLSFMQTATGKHVMIWQADQQDNSGLSDLCDTYGHELRFVTNSYSSIASRASVPTNDAEANVSGRDSAKDVNYIFVPEGSPAAVTAWNAQTLTSSNASSLASRLDSTPSWSQVKRITYELQDLADIIPTHWQNNPWYVHWLSDDWTDILLESPILNEAGQAEVSTGLQRFYTKSRDSGLSGLTDGRNGIPSKEWLFGAYSAELDEDCPSGSDDFEAFEGYGTDSYGNTRGAASGNYASHNAYWWQHDFFVHSGAIVDADTSEAGKWLVGAWYTPANGGFDGRWVQLFADNPVAGTATFTSVAAQDGYITESGESTSAGGNANANASTVAGLRAGDNLSDWQFKSIVSFDTSSIPDGATITSATLRLRRGTLVGTNPFTTHGTCKVDIHKTGFGGDVALAPADFQAAATATGVATMSSPAADLDWSSGSLNAAGLAAINKLGTTQLRVYFTLDDDDDSTADYIGFYAADNTTAANRPQLVVTYTP
jgi:hypothetical protein